MSYTYPIYHMSKLRKRLGKFNVFGINFLYTENMNYKYRRRSLSRDSYRRYSSDDLSVSRSRSLRRYRRSVSRSKRSYSKPRRRFSRDRRSYSSGSTDGRHHRERRRHRSPSAEKTNTEPVSVNGNEAETPKVAQRKRIRNMSWKLPNANDFPDKNTNFNAQRRTRSNKFNFNNRFDHSLSKTSLENFRYESDEFKVQKEKMHQALKEKEDSSREAKKLLSDYTKELNTLVGNLSKLPKDSEEYKESSEKIQSLKKAMKDLISQERQVTKSKPMKPAFDKNISLDNRETKIFFPNLPDCAKGKGNLAKWISENSKFLLPQKIAMLASHGTTYEAAVIEYKTHDVAQRVLNSCKLHGITVTWMHASEISSETTENNKGSESATEVIQPDSLQII
ncbi:uncharacterized protein TA16960 [Theileria annulata]|uniref:Uncharacterized protein n=1 Tax=Theileria annulata TaxID=5874 RepID=Q4UIN0_THEAN|nr:uncharacterized protein TA16960 [Theileria annulata]CAI73059.1 hypothetical protein TA16960 [Theileria annulata]|eukprot:XP_953737.1 hypothetical protein TA16960 [Theileria annulata]